MNKLSNEQKAMLYNEGLRRYQKIQEEIRQIKASSVNISDRDQKRIDVLEKKMKEIYNRTKVLYS